MFEKFVTATNNTSSSKKTVSMEKTTEFVQAVVEDGKRLSYSALTIAARALGEDSSRQFPGQRGAVLAKRLPVTLQPYICRQGGGYADGISWPVEVPKDLRDRPVIGENFAEAAVTAFAEMISGDDPEDDPEGEEDELTE